MIKSFVISSFYHIRHVNEATRTDKIAADKFFEDDVKFSFATDSETMSSDGNSNIGSSKSPYRKRIKNSNSSNNSSSNSSSNMLSSKPILPIRANDVVNCQLTVSIKASIHQLILA
jgi:hypothetical protein